MKSHLKIKVCSLGDEMTRIHRDEIKWKRKAKIARAKVRDTSYHMDNFWSLRNHRTDLKIEARIAHIAYSFLLGNSYADIEPLAYSAPDWGRIGETVERFTKDEPTKPTDNKSVMERLSEWINAAQEYSKASVEKATARLNIPRQRGEHKAGTQRADAAPAE